MARWRSVLLQVSQIEGRETRLELNVDHGDETGPSGVSIERVWLVPMVDERIHWEPLDVALRDIFVFLAEES